MDRGEIEDRFSRTPLLRVVLDMASVYFREAGHITFHDPLAAALVFERALCTFRVGDVTINVTPDTTGHAFTKFIPNPDGQARVAATVDSDAFFEEYFSRTIPGWISAVSGGERPVPWADAEAQDDESRAPAPIWERSVRDEEL
jgi:hypothetical protein